MNNGIFLNSIGLGFGKIAELSDLENEIISNLKFNNADDLIKKLSNNGNKTFSRNDSSVFDLVIRL